MAKYEGIGKIEIKGPISAVVIKVNGVEIPVVSFVLEGDLFNGVRFSARLPENVLIDVVELDRARIKLLQAKEG